MGNRLRQETHNQTNLYTYDIANRLISVDGVSYSWDDNGNLLADGERTYVYDHANRLTSVAMGSDTFTFAYNGLGDRLRQTINTVPQNYTLDIVSGLTQVLSDEADSYLYGVGRIGQEGGWLAVPPGRRIGQRATGEPRADPVGYAQAFEPYGPLLSTAGDNATSLAFTGEWTDRTGLVHLRARYYVPEDGLFVSKDPLGGTHSRARNPPSMELCRFQPYHLRRSVWTLATGTRIRVVPGGFS